jgi:hypothetical protein
MSLLLVPVAAYLLLYAPGHYALRAAASDQTAGSRLFREVLLSACCTSWFGLVLAELSVYSLPALLSCQAGVAAIAALLSRGRQPRPYDSKDLVGVAVAVASWIVLSPPLDTRILGSDSAGYLAAGVHLSRHGSLIIHDPTLPLLPSWLKFVLFPSVGPAPWTPPYMRLLGSLVLRTGDADEVLPAFHHLITVWVAIFHGLGGSAAAQWTITLFGGLSVWAMVAFAAASRGSGAAFAFFVLLSLSAVQSWYSRFLMPEIPGQFFLWGGLCCAAFWRGTQRRADAVVAGFAFGIAGLMRIENAVFLFPALLLGLWFAEGKLRTQRIWLMACALALWAHAAVHLLYFRTHYLGILVSVVSEVLALFTTASWPRNATLGACIVALLLWQYRRGFAGLRSMVPVAVLGACVAAWGAWQHGWSGLDLLAAYIGLPTLIAGGLGLAVWTEQIEPADVASRVLVALTGLALVQVLLAPHATEVPIWVIRRSATIVLPALCLGVVVLCQVAGRRWHRAAAAPILFLAIAGQARPFAQLRLPPYYQGGLGHLEAVAAMLPRPAVLIFDTQLATWGFAPGLWAEHDMPAYIISRFDVPYIQALVRALDGLPVYWIGDNHAPTPAVPGVTVTRVGSYPFTTLTPTLDKHTSPGMSNQWNLTAVVYALRLQGKATEQ